MSKNTLNFENALTSEYFIGLFLQNLPSSSDDSKKDCNQYFDLLCKLIEDTYSSSTHS